MKRVRRTICVLLLICLLAATLPLGASAVRISNRNAIETLNAVLSGISLWYLREEPEVSAWEEDHLLSAMCVKLQNEALGLDTFLQDYAGMQIRQESDGVHFDLEFVQKACRSAFGVEFPLSGMGDVLRVEGDEVILMPATGEHVKMHVFNYVEQDGTVWATGCVVYSGALGQNLQAFFLAEFAVNPDSIYGYTLHSLMQGYSNYNMTGWQARASSELKQDYGTHYASHLLDGDPATAWCEGADGVGRGEWIELTTSDGEPREFSGIEIRNGYQKNQDILGKNGWATKILVECDDGFSREFYLDWNDLDYSNILLFDQPIYASRVKVTILEAQAGTKYQDTCISEICLLGLDSRDIFADLQLLPQTEPDPAPEAETTAATVPSVPAATEPEPSAAAPTEPALTEPVEVEDDTGETSPAEAKTSGILLKVVAAIAALCVPVALILYGRKKR